MMSFTLLFLVSGQFSLNVIPRMTTLAFSRSQPCLYHLFNCGISHKRTHGVINLSTIQNYLAVIAETLCDIRQVIGINTNAMTTNQTRFKTQRIPLGVHPRQNLIRVNTHSVTDHSDFIHESDINITLAVLYNLHCFRSLDIRDTECASLDHNVINLLNDLASSIPDTIFRMLVSV